ncbi:MAG: carboxylesterase family protein [Caulobacteraceae bacterium]|nr:carboxylesterase family protein [Caulobacteraceae bacterium]
MKRSTAAALIAGLATICLLGGHAALAAASPDVVGTDSGKVQGTAAGDVLSFKGIPFAAPPVGDLRWRPPAAATHWDSIRQATAYGHDCMQKPMPGDLAPIGVEPGEDCLFLNVWRPAAAATAKLPVMVWIHGGGFVNGGSSPAVYDGSQFARQGIVLVSFNYRLGRFGFFAHPALSQKNPSGPLANYGLMDQIAALQWVKRNISAFGGDTRNVTVFGESAGGISVHVLATAPAAKGLFQKAIVESGGGRGLVTGRRHLRTQEAGEQPSAEAVGLAFAKSVGIEGEDAAALAALRQLPAEKIVSGLNLATMFGSATFAGPVIDGQIVVDEPEALYRAGKAAHIKLMIGANNFDIGFFKGHTVDELVAPFGAAATQQVLKTYDPDNTGKVSAIGMRMGTDQTMIEPARFVAKTLSSQGRSVYEYRFSYVADTMRQKYPGAMHATEIPFVFDTLHARDGDKVTPQDEKVAQLANGYWVAFAKSGNPNGQGRPKWPAYNASHDELLEFTVGGDAVAEPDPWKARLDLTETRSDQSASVKPAGGK